MGCYSGSSRMAEAPMEARSRMMDQASMEMYDTSDMIGADYAPSPEPGCW